MPDSFCKRWGWSSDTLFLHRVYTPKEVGDAGLFLQTVRLVPRRAEGVHAELAAASPFSRHVHGVADDGGGAAVEVVVGGEEEGVGVERGGGAGHVLGAGHHRAAQRGPHHQILVHDGVVVLQEHAEVQHGVPGVALRVQRGAGVLDVLVLGHHQREPRPARSLRHRGVLQHEVRGRPVHQAVATVGAIPVERK